MTIYDRFTNFFRGASVEEEAEEKTIDLNAVLPGVSDGKMYYMHMNGLSKAYSTNYVINKCINILSYNLSKLPLRISRNGEPLPVDFKLPRGFDISQPHPRVSLAKLLYEACVYYWYKGEFMVLIDDENPFSLEPVDPSSMKIADAEGRMITAWRFDTKDVIQSEQLIYAPMMNPELINTSRITDHERTISLTKVVERELKNYTSGREYNTQFFNNFAQLGLTLTDVNGNTTKEDRQAIVDQIDNKLSRGKAWKTRCLPQGLDLAKTKDMTMREMEFSQSLKDIRDIILGIYGVPRSVFGITNEAGLAQSTVDAENRLMWTNAIQPAAHMIQEAFNQTLMRNYFPGYKVFFDYSVIDVLQDNMTEKLTLAKQYQELGYSTEEINTALSLKMQESTDTRMNERFYPSTLVSYSEVEYDISEPTKDVDSNIVLDKETKGISPQRYRSKFNRNQRAIEKVMTGKLGLYFAKQRVQVLSLLTDQKTVKDVNETLLLSDIMNLLQEEKKVLQATMQPEYVNGALRGSGLALNTLNLDKPPVASDIIVGELTNRIATINNYTYDLLKTQIKESINAGETISQMSNRITQVYKFNKSRARMIARTESLKVLSRSSDEEYRSAGVKKKQWLSSPGARDSHAACTGQGAIPYDSAFINGLQFPGDAGPAAEVINCRCALAPVIE